MRETLTARYSGAGATRRLRLCDALGQTVVKLTGDQSGIVEGGRYVVTIEPAADTPVIPSTKTWTRPRRVTR